MLRMKDQRCYRNVIEIRDAMLFTETCNALPRMDPEETPLVMIRDSMRFRTMLCSEHIIRSSIEKANTRRKVWKQENEKRIHREENV